LAKIFNWSWYNKNGGGVVSFLCLNYIIINLLIIILFPFRLLKIQKQLVVYTIPRKVFYMGPLWSIINSSNIKIITILFEQVAYKWLWQIINPHKDVCVVLSYSHVTFFTNCLWDFLVVKWRVKLLEVSWKLMWKMFMPRVAHFTYRI
jgi:hypothetical protein